MSRQSAFAGAVLDATAQVPPGLSDGRGRASARRFAVYRNNVAVSLIEALETAFPVVRKLVGNDFFRAMAGVFVRDHPPTDRRMALYGAALPQFLARFEPAAGLPYLPDVARLEQALRDSYHAADAPALAASRVTGLGAEALAALAVRPAPATRVVRSDHPVLSIWRTNTGTPAPIRPGAQDVLVTRPGFDPAPHPLPAGGAVLLEALQRGLPLGPAAEVALAGHADIDLPGLMGHLTATAALTEGPA